MTQVLLACLNRGRPVLAGILLCLIASSPVRGQGTSKPSTQPVSLLRFLDATGMLADCYFTVEYHRTSQDTPSRLPAVLLNNPPQLRDVPAVLKYLGQVLPDADVKQDPDNAAVVRVVEKSAVAMPQYVMESKVTIHTTGTPAELIAALGKPTDGAVCRRKAGDWRDSRNDTLTRLQVHAVDMPVRKVLTDFLPLSQYQRVLWVAETTPYEGKIETWVQFRGPATSIYLESAPGHNAVPEGQAMPFSWGQVAYAWNLALKEEVAGQALTFLGPPGAKVPTQGRWAMLYLGARRSPGATSALLERLEYRYTTSQLVAEDYPSLHALVLMGPEGAAGAMDALPTADAKRAVLLCHVVLRVHGVKAGKGLLDERVAKTTDARQHDLLAKAVATAVDLESRFPEPATQPATQAP